MAYRGKVLQLYKSLLRECQKFNSYNYRLYFVRRTKDAFQENKKETDPVVIQNLIRKGEENLEIIKRQILVGQMFGEGHLIIEQKPPRS